MGKQPTVEELIVTAADVYAVAADCSSCQLEHRCHAPDKSEHDACKMTFMQYMHDRIDELSK